MVHDKNYRWTETDTKTLGILAYEIKKLEHEKYLLRKQIIVKKKFIEKHYAK